jgi:protein-S-isoprenylcysteine O-methyltransferase Ste14
LVLQATGLGLRIWSMRTLGASYSRTLRTQDEQPVVDNGPYGLIRHPGYLGSLLTWTGFGLTSRSLPVVVTVSGLLGRAYRHRIAAEEDLLRRGLAGYIDYSRRTKKLVPFIW